MKFVKIGKNNAGGYLVDKLVSLLNEKERVVWFISGGSNLPISAEAMKAVPKELTSSLSVCLVDERYGEVGHKDSNWLQLFDLGFDKKLAKVFPVLANKGLRETADLFSERIKELLDNSYSFAQFGIGPDGHIGGMLPHTVASSEQEKFAVGYEAGSFTRITMTSVAMSKLDEAYAFVFGGSKKDALNNLFSKDMTIDDQPAQILKKINKSIVYNDQIS